MVHVTRSRRAEVVLFGREQRFSTPLAVNAGNQIMVTSTGDDEIAVSKFSVHDADQKRVVSTKVDDVIRAIVDFGGTYPDVVQALQEAKASRRPAEPLRGRGPARGGPPPPSAEATAADAGKARPRKRRDEASDQNIAAHSLAIPLARMRGRTWT